MRQDLEDRRSRLDDRFGLDVETARVTHWA